jgi:hypothetical protein
LRYVNFITRDDAMLDVVEETHPRELVSVRIFLCQRCEHCAHSVGPYPTDTDYGTLPLVLVQSV